METVNKGENQISQTLLALRRRRFYNFRPPLHQQVALRRIAFSPHPTRPTTPKPPLQHSFQFPQFAALNALKSGPAISLITSCLKLQGRISRGKGGNHCDVAMCEISFHSLLPSPTRAHVCEFEKTARSRELCVFVVWPLLAHHPIPPLHQHQ